METFKINYKSDFVLRLASDAGWGTVFTLEFWSKGAPTKRYYATHDGNGNYTNCKPDSDTELRVMFDDHGLGIGNLMLRITYSLADKEFRTGKDDEVVNVAAITVLNDEGEEVNVMLNLEGETAAEVQYSLPLLEAEKKRQTAETQRNINEAQRIAAEQHRQLAETLRNQAELGRQASEDTRKSSERARQTAEAARATEFETNEAARKETFETNEAERQAIFEANEAERQVLYEKVAKNTEDIELLNANTGISEYPEFSEAKAYAVGDIVLYEGLLKRFISAHEAGAWDSAQVEDWSEKKEREEDIQAIRENLGGNISFISESGNGALVAINFIQGRKYKIHNEGDVACNFATKTKEDITVDGYYTIDADTYVEFTASGDADYLRIAGKTRGYVEVISAWPEIDSAKNKIKVVEDELNLNKIKSFGSSETSVILSGDGHIEYPFVKGYKYRITNDGKYNNNFSTKKEITGDYIDHYTCEAGESIDFIASGDANYLYYTAPAIITITTGGLLELVDIGLNRLETSINSTDDTLEKSMMQTFGGQNTYSVYTSGHIEYPFVKGYKYRITNDGKYNNNFFTRESVDGDFIDGGVALAGGSFDFIATKNASFLYHSAAANIIITAKGLVGLVEDVNSFDKYALQPGMYDLDKNIGDDEPSYISTTDYVYCVAVCACEGQSFTITALLGNGSKVKSYGFSDSNGKLYKMSQVGESLNNAVLEAEKNGKLFINVSSSAIDDFSLVVSKNIIDVLSEVCKTRLSNLKYAPRYINAPYPRAKESLKILAVGNSFTVDGTQYISELMAAANDDTDKLCLYRIYNSSASLDYYNTNFYTIEQEAYRCAGSIDMQNKGTTEEIVAQDWDIIIIQQDSMKAFKWDTYKVLPDYIEKIRAACSNQNVCIGWQLVWGHSIEPNNQSGLRDVEELEGNINCCIKMINEYGIDFIIPTGTAIQNARNSALQNEYNLTRDNWHLSYGLGVYIASCTWYQMLLAPLFNKSILGNHATHIISTESSEYSETSVDVTDGNKLLAQKCAFKACMDMYNTHEVV